MEELEKDLAPAAAALIREARGAFEAGEFGQAYRLSVDALAHVGGDSLRGEILFDAGRFARAAGERKEAVELLRTFLADLEQFPQLRDRGEPLAHYYLGLTLRESGDHLDAALEYRRAAGLARERRHMDLLCRTLHNQAWVCCLLGMAEQARECLDEASPLCSTTELLTHQSLGISFVGAVDGMLETADMVEALFAQITATPALRSQAGVIASMLALVRQEMQPAMAFAQAALQFAGEAREERLLMDAQMQIRNVETAIAGA
jgi:tetratricopeptide (TPR) repeat protein